MAVIPVHVAGAPYEVRVEAGLLAELVPNCRGLLRKREVPIVTDTNVFRLWGEVVETALRAHGHEPHWRILPAGEQSKSWAELAAIIDWLLDLGIERNDHLLALGGGVIGDLAGFASAIVKRGCRFIQLPTTLLAQVDSSVGGKTAINTSAGKNLVGAFHQPSLVLADLAVLDTLPERELLAGYAEVVKYGLIADADFFHWCDTNGPAMLAGEARLREYAVAHSVSAKARIVAEDERETTGRRALLNLGHTFGHALEAETGYSDRLLHGEAVAIGMVLAARYSARLGRMPKTSAEHVAQHFARIGMRSELSQLGLSCDAERLIEHMLHDKKMDAGTLLFVLLRGIGEAYIDREVSLADVTRFLEEQLAG
ncbi:MAG: 3-dehydroquinate synthase [Novosphingobium sp.]|nr:3-dehydroquinate synthase [Novosphingobium sp.]